MHPSTFGKYVKDTGRGWNAAFGNNIPSFHDLEKKCFFYLRFDFFFLGDNNFIFQN
jgi:hypothetical protein